jgi:sugar phosphate isomerase/epimerase
MKLGYLTPLTLETITNAKKLGYDAIEVGAGWLNSPALQQVEANLPALRDALVEHQIGINAVAIYGSAVEASVDEAVAYYGRAMKVARALGCSVVAGMTGRDNSKTFDDNLPLFKARFTPIAKLAEEQGIHIAFEPWPGSVQGHGPYHWTNMATTPELWDKLFEAVPNLALGLEYDPSHLAWQEIDYLQVIRDYGSRIYHMHAKDIVIDQAKLKHVGVHGRGWWRFVIPGLGQLDWKAIFAALKQVDYRGDVAVEHEDNTYLRERWNEGLALGIKTLRPFINAF